MLFLKGLNKVDKRLYEFFVLFQAPLFEVRFSEDNWGLL